jgi:iron complex outermembrane receptor protein
MSRSQTRIRALLLKSALPAALIAGFGAAPAFAADAPKAADQGNTVGEVVVTAQFREQSLQKTPLAITAVNAQMLEQKSQTNLFQVAAQAPNVTLKPAGAAFGSAMVAFIRGVGQTDFNFSQEPGVGIYVDDVYYATLTGSLLDLTDVDRVEILRGPQGTLAGRNSIGGAIKLYSKKPNGEGGGYLEGTYGSLNRIDARGAMDFTVVPDKLFARITVAERHHDGYVTRLDYACTHPGSGLPTFHVGTGCKLGEDGGQAYSAAKIALRWLPSEKAEVNLFADATNDQSPVQANTIVYARPNGLFLNGVAYDNKFVPYGPNAGDPNHPNDPFLSYATFIDPGQGEAIEAGWKPVVVPPINHYRSWGVGGTIDYRFNDDWSIKSITGFRYFDNSFAEDTPSSPIGVQLLLQTLHHRQVTQELRLNGKIFNSVDVTIGGFYAHQSGDEEARVDLPYVGAGVPYVCVISPAPCGTVKNFAFDFVHGPDTSPSTAKAVFGQADWHIVNGLELVGGIRYSDDSKDYTYHRHNPDGTLPCGTPNLLDPLIPGCPNWLVAGLNGQSASFHSTRIDWRAALQYQFTPDFMGYAQASTGYKGGGINARPFFGKGAGCPDPDCQVKPFNPETLTSYEIGLKSFLFDHKVRFNAAGFYNKYNDIILQLSSCPNNSPGATLEQRIGQPCAMPVNAGRANVKGFELESELHPVSGLEMDASLSYLDFKYTFIPELDAATGRSTTTGISIHGVTPFTPKWKWNFGAQYEMPVGNAGSLTPRIDFVYQSDVFTSPLNQPGDVDPSKTLVNTNNLAGFDPAGPQLHADRISGYMLVNARLTWKSMDRSWQAALEVTNLGDKLYYLTLFDLAEGGLPGYTAGQPGMGRQWAITVKKTF